MTTSVINYPFQDILRQETRSRTKLLLLLSLFVAFVITAAPFIFTLFLYHIEQSIINVRRTHTHGPETECTWPTRTACLHRMRHSYTCNSPDALECTRQWWGFGRTHPSAVGEVSPASSRRASSANPIKSLNRTADCTGRAASLDSPTFPACAAVGSASPDACAATAGAETAAAGSSAKGRSSSGVSVGTGVA